MVQKYIIDKVDIPRLLNGEEIPLEQGSKARAFCVEIAGGMTNGEVLKAIFPDCIDYHGIIEVKTHLDMGMTFRRSWWDSPYKGQDGLI